MKQSNLKIAIAGGGIAGLATAIALRKLGFRPVVFESAPEIKALGAGLALAANAIKALERIGIVEKVVAAGKQLDTFSILDQQGKTITVADNRALSARYGINNFTIHRGELHRILLQEAHGVEIHTGKKVIGFRESDRTITLQFQDETEFEADVLLAADGIHSAIRKQLIPDSTLRYAGYTCWRAVIQDPGIKLKGSSETWGAAGRFGIVPLANDLIYWFLCIDAARQDPAMRAMTAEALAERFKDYHYPVADILKATRNEEMLWNDIIDLKPVSRFAFSRVLLLGDAAHATTPNIGQGACQALEDVAVLMDQWEKMPDAGPETVFRKVEQLRMKRSQMIVSRSWTVGKMAQWRNPLAISLRNTMFRMVPASANEMQLKELYRVAF